jgi:phosphoribosylglycinamide formyltransferase-1
MIRIAILGSGSGSNARNILTHFQASPSMEISLIAHNKLDIGIIQHAYDFQVPTYYLTKENFLLSNEFLEELKHRKIDWIILAGFLWKIPSSLCDAFAGKIINIHPALLPKYGGKGMYGHFVHEAVFHAKEKESGITIHLVNEEYDKGAILFQASVALEEQDTPEIIEKKVRQLEIKHFPSVIEKKILQP